MHRGLQDDERAKDAAAVRIFPPLAPLGAIALGVVLNLAPRAQIRRDVSGLQTARAALDLTIKTHLGLADA